MEVQHMFLSGDTTIDLNEVVDVVEPPASNSAQEQDNWIMVMLEGGSFTTIKGHTQVHAFMEAMDDHLGANLI